MKNLSIFKIKIFFLLVFTLIAQNIFAESSAVKLKVVENGELIDIATKDKKPILKNVDNDVTISSPSILRLDGRIPILVIPLKSKGSEVKFDPPTYQEAATEYGQLQVSLIVSEIMIGIQNIQKDIQKKKYDSAYMQTQELQQKYPKVPFLDFLRGSILYLQGRKESAREAVKKALEAHPDFEAGKEFLKSIGGSDDKPKGD